MRVPVARGIASRLLRGLGERRIASRPSAARNRGLRRPRALSALGALLLVAPPTIVAQTPMPVPHTILTAPSCRTCRVQVQHVGLLPGTGPISESMGFEDLVAVNDSLIVAIPSEGTGWWLIDLNGRVIAEYGREGEGPGEFKGAQEVARFTADSVSIYDRALARVSVFSLNGKYARALRTPAGALSFVHWDADRGVAVGRFADRDGSGPRDVLPYHPVVRDSITRSFGPRPEAKDLRNPDVVPRILLRWGWFSIGMRRVNEYAVEMYDFTGRPIGKLSREVDRFPKTDIFVVGDPDTPPSTLIQDAWVEKNGLLFVLISRAGEHWRDAFAKTSRAAEGGQTYRPIDREDLYSRGVVEVFDLKSRSLLVSQDLPFVPSYGLGRGLVAAKVPGPKDPTGAALDLYRVTLVGEP